MLRLIFVVESGTDVRLIDGLAPRYDLRVLARALPGGVEVSWPPRRNVPVTIGPESRAGFARFVRAQLAHSGGDFVLAQGYGLAALAASGSALPAALLVCSPVEEYYACRHEANDPAKPYRWRELVALRAVARWNAMRDPDFVVLSEHLADVVRGHGARRVHIVPVYGVDLRIFRPAGESREALRKRLGLPAGPLIFFSSRIAPEKDAGTLLRAVRILRDAGTVVRVLHRSGGWEQFAALAANHGVGDLVIATDAVPPFDLLAHDYRACDLTVQASRAEGLGFSVLESLACGTPVVAAAVGGLRETVIDGETGWSYPAGDAEALSGAIADLLDHPEEAGRRAQRGGAMVANMYERGRVFDMLDSLIHTIVGRQK